MVAPVEAHVLEVQPFRALISSALQAQLSQHTPAAPLHSCSFSHPPPLQGVNRPETPPPDSSEQERAKNIITSTQMTVENIRFKGLIGPSPLFAWCGLS